MKVIGCAKFMDVGTRDLSKLEHGFVVYVKAIVCILSQFVAK